MAKTADKPTPAGFWMSLREAVERAGSFEALLPHLQGEKRVLARARDFLNWPDGGRLKVLSHYIDPAWWDAVRSDDWARGQVCFKMDIGDVMAIRVELERAAVEALWPGAPNEHNDVRGAGAWIAAEAKRMKAANEVPDGIKITDFAKELERRMCEAADKDESLRAVGWRHIKNKLPEWGLWPVSSIR